MGKAARCKKSFHAVFALVMAMSTASPTVAQDSSCENRPTCIGTVVDQATYAAWDITILPDGRNLPEGQGNAAEGREVYDNQCAVCHGENGMGGVKEDPDHASYPALVPGENPNPLSSVDSWPTKTIATYWPYPTTVFDYVRRAMPLTHAQSLSDNEVYAVVAYLLAEGGVISDDTTMNKTTLISVQMPNKDGFVCDARPDTANARCMENCPVPGDADFDLGKPTQTSGNPEDCMIVQ